MIPIAALLNDDIEEEKRDGELEIKVEPVYAVRALFGRQTSSIECTSSDEMEEDHSPEDDEDSYEHIKQERNSLTTTETSSLLGALTLQNLRYAPAATPTSDITHDTEATATRAYLSMDNLTNPVGEGEDAVRDNKPPTPSQEARAARRRSTRALFPGASDEDRRAKQRMIVKRCYYKKINTINELRDQVQQLEGVLNSVLEEQEEQRGQELATAEDAAIQSLVDQYVDTVKDKEVLRHENQRLRKLADEFYMKNQGRLRVLLDANRKEMILFTPGISDE